MYNISTAEGFDTKYTVETVTDGVELITITASSDKIHPKLTLYLTFEEVMSDIHTAWAPMEYHNRGLRPSWGMYHESKSFSSAPIISNIAHNENNRLTIACSDTVHVVRMKSGVIERMAMLTNSVTVIVDAPTKEYTVSVRIDRRDIPFYKAVADVVEWWDSFEGCGDANIPDEAKRPMYSSWYAFKTQLSPEAVAEECRFFKELGCDTVIVDHGWESRDEIKGAFITSGDWVPNKDKIPDMKAFVDLVHSCGMKIMLWYCVPLVGLASDNYKRFEDKILGRGQADTNMVLDPRYPEIREHLISTLKNAVTEWGLDGFKIDFIDYFIAKGEVKPGMDYTSICEAVVRLLDDMKTELYKLNPNILIEYRQTYYGPHMRSFGNMMRSSDCPNDSYTNRMNTLSTRLICGKTPVHSDMMMWHGDEPAEYSAYQFTETLFSVPQVSVRCEKLSEDHKKMVRFMLGFWNAHRDTLLDGEMLYKNYAEGFTYVSARKENEQVGAVYAGKIAYVEKLTDRMYIVNASPDDSIIIESPEDSVYTYTVVDCMGNHISEGKLSVCSVLTKISVPQNGIVTLTRT